MPFAGPGRLPLCRNQLRGCRPVPGSVGRRRVAELGSGRRRLVAGPTSSSSTQPRASDAAEGHGGRTRANAGVALSQGQWQGLVRTLPLHRGKAGLSSFGVIAAKL